MPTWGELLKEIAELQQKDLVKATNRAQSGLAPLPPAVPGTPSPFDVVRRKYLKQLAKMTGRAVIVYHTSWTDNKPQIDGQGMSVGLGDMVGFMEACSNVDERELDLFLHSPGGSAEAAEAIMRYLRTRFDHIRVIVPVAAMSAATMMALAADEIVMGAHSQLGPIDPQLTISTPEGPRSAPGQAILDQFEQAKEECRDPQNIAAWLPILRGYGPGLLAVCKSQGELAEDFATRSLEAHMFASDPATAHERAEAAAKWFADFKEFRSHGRRVGRDNARAQGLTVTDLEADDKLQDAMLSVFHAVSHTTGATQAYKVIENHKGRAWIQQMQLQQILVPAAAPVGPVVPSKKGPKILPAGVPRAIRP